MRWRTIPRYSNFEVSDTGIVRRCAVGGSPIGSHIGAVKPQKTTASGYKTVYLCQDGKWSYPSVHRLVLEAFVGPAPTPKHQAAHYDGVRSNNTLGNLRWATARENSADRLRHGTHLRGEDCGAARFTEGEIHDIRRLADSGLSHEKIAKRVRTSQSHVSRIVRGENWGWLK